MKKTVLNVRHNHSTSRNRSSEIPQQAISERSEKKAFQIEIISLK